jgi:hypothetical protein
MLLSDMRRFSYCPVWARKEEPELRPLQTRLCLGGLVSDMRRFSSPVARKESKNLTLTIGKSAVLRRFS